MARPRPGSGGADAERAAQRGHALRAVLRPDSQRPVDRRQESRGHVRHAALGERRTLVVDRARRRRRRRRSIEQVGDQGAEGVQVGPGPLTQRLLSAYCSIGAKFGFSTAVSSWVRSPITWRAAPKSSSTGRPSPAQQHVVGRDVAVIDALGVEHLERVEQRVDELRAARLRSARRASRAHILAASRPRRYGIAM